MPKANVLVVEDEGIIAWNIENILTRFGYSVVGVAASGTEAIEKVGETNPDVVLMDIRLQGEMDGIEAAEQIHVRFNVPVIYLTAHANDHIIERAKATQPFGYIIKPFQEKELNATIELALYKFRIERDLQTEKDWFSKVLKNMGDSVIVTDEKGTVTFMNPFAEALTGWERDEAFGKDVREVLKLEHTEATDNQENPILRAIERGTIVRLADQWILRSKQGMETPISDSAAPIRDENGNITGVVAIFQDITERKHAEKIIQQQIERERLIGLITQRIRQSLDVREVLYTTVTQVQQFLQTDRVLVYRFEPDWSGIVVVESIEPGWTSLLAKRLLDPCFAQHCVELYRQGRVQVTDDIHAAGLRDCHIKFLEGLQVRANLVVPILQGEQLWGLLVAHHCRGPRRWQRFDVELLQQLAAQVGIAIQQSELHQQVQFLNAELERQVQEQTAQLRQALNFDAMLKRITDSIRDSLDENQVLQRVVQELTIVLGIYGCDAAMYDANSKTATIRYEYTTPAIPAAQGRIVQFEDFLEGYKQLLTGQYFQFCERVPSLHGSVTTLACPILDDQGVLGDLWLFKRRQETFTELETELVQHVANQCAITIRQARLYQAAQTQVVELERLNQLKDDFLNTVSHELRTPMSNMMMAIQMLDIMMQREGPLNAENHQIAKYLGILREEGKREVNLINDLLDLQRLSTEVIPLTPSTILLQDWISQLIKPFESRLQHQQQTLAVDIPIDLPPITTDLPSLERILTELLNNACKYTSGGERIALIARAVDGELQLKVSNTGVEIASTELSRIFDKFYRIPNHDPWKHAGTGLGLALVKKLVESLGGTIQATSGENQTTFFVRLPLMQPLP